MTSPNLQDWFYIELTAKAYADGSSTTYKLSNRPVIDDVASSFSDYDALLLNISGVGCKMGQYLPQASSGTITIDNSPGSYAFERRFSDLLERYSIIDQTVKIYAAQTQYNDFNVTADFSLAYTARVKDWRIDPVSGTLNIQIAGTQIIPRVITKVIDSVAFPSAPSQSLGKVIPMVFGNAQEVPGIRIDADADTSPAYAYATTLSTTFPVGGIGVYYAKEKTSGKYLAVSSASAVGTAVVSQATAGGIATSTGSSYEEFANSITSGYVVTAGRVLFIGKSSGGWTAGGDSKLAFNIYKLSPLTGLPDVRVGTATRLKSSVQTSFRAAGDFYVEFAFSEPVVMNSPDGYVMGISQTVDSTAGTGSGDDVQWRTDGTHSVYRWYLYNGSLTLGNATRTWNKASVTRVDTDPVYDLYGCKMTDTQSSAGATADGLGYASFEVTQNTSIGSDYSYPDLTKLDWVVATNGMYDDSSGTLTGTPSSLLTIPISIVRLLERVWSGSAWGAGPIDFTLNTSTHNSSVIVRGCTNGKTTAEQALSDICKNTVSRINLVNGASKQLSFWQYGTTIAITTEITDEDATITNIEQRGIESIVNRLTFYYDRRFRDLDFTTGSSQGQFRNYAKTLDWYSSFNNVTTYYSAESYTMFGNKPAAESTYDYFADSVSAEYLGRFLLANGAFPDEYVTLEVPFFKYRTLECLNVIEIIHPDLPSYFGTSANAKLATYTGTEVDLLGGHYWKRAKSYRAQIEAKEMIFNAGGTSRLKLDCRLLLNSPKEVT